MSDSETVARDEFFDSLLGDFLDESGQLLDRLNEDLLQLDEWVRSLAEDHTQQCDDELMNNMFRSAHSLKGLSAMLGLGDINGLTHKVENVFDAARKDELTIHGDVVELMFQAVDRLVGLVDGLKEPDAESVECESVVQSIGQLLESAGVAHEASSQEDAEKALQELMDTPSEESDGTTATSAEAPPTEPTPPTPSPETPEDVTPAEPAQPVDFFEGLENESDVPSKYLSIFIDETDMSLDQLTETLLALEGGGSPEEIQTLLVISHRIKGSAASVGLNRAAKLAHLMEDLLQNLVDNGRALWPEVTDALLKCSDSLRQHVEGLKQGGPQADQFNQIAHELLGAQRAEQPADPSSPVSSGQDEPIASQPAATPTAADAAPPTASITDKLREQVRQAASDPSTAFVGTVVFDANLPLVGLKAQLIHEKLSNLGEVCVFDPPENKLDEIEQLDQVTFGLSTDKPLKVVLSQLRIAGIRQTVVEPLEQNTSPAAAPKPATPATAKQEAAPKKPSAPTKARAADSSTRPTETLRVDIERLDQLMSLAGQLVINKARFSRIGDSLKVALANKQSSRVLGNVFRSLDKMASADGGGTSETDLQSELELLRGQARRVQNDLEAVRRDVEMLAGVRGYVNDLMETIHQLDRVTDGIQQSVMDTRMLPIGPLFTRFKRVIRDITRSNGKSINLLIRGEKTELDKRMIDELSDPLIHMVRNSADHGIESPEDREAAGKPPEGTVTLDAFHRGNSIIIQVTDDGKGLDLDRIRQKAVDKGLHPEAELDRMTPHQIYNLIWEPGLSTAEKVTEVSGRGMGMDIVKSKIEDLNGIVDLDSEPGKGTTLTIKLPLTLAILPSLMVEIDGDIFAMPLESIVEIVGVSGTDMATVHGKMTARVRGRVISTVNLDEIFTWNRTATHDSNSDANETTLVIVGEEGCEIGLAVHRVLGEEDVVIKSMADNYRNVPGIAGASILGDGRVSLILDLAALIEMSSNNYAETAI